MQVVLLESTVGELYSFASEPLPESHSQQHDLRQSHALNILKVRFSFWSNFCQCLI